MDFLNLLNVAVQFPVNIISSTYMHTNGGPSNTTHIGPVTRAMTRRIKKGDNS